MGVNVFLGVEFRGVVQRGTQWGLLDNDHPVSSLFALLFCFFVPLLNYEHPVSSCVCLFLPLRCTMPAVRLCRLGKVLSQSVFNVLVGADGGVILPRCFLQCVVYLCFF